MGPTFRSKLLFRPAAFVSSRIASLVVLYFLSLIRKPQESFSVMQDSSGRAEAD